MYATQTIPHTEHAVVQAQVSRCAAAVLLVEKQVKVTGKMTLSESSQCAL